MITYDGRELVRYADAIGVEYDTLRRYRDVARAYESANRFANLSWSHHLVAAAQEDRLEWLKAAEEEGYSVAQLRQALSERRPMQRVYVQVSMPEPSEPQTVQAIVSTTPPPPASNVLFSSESGEWLTPPEIVDRVDAVLGAIDLDPCSDVAKSIPAAQHFTLEDDGLGREWCGRIYLNPPYGREIDAWIEKLVAEHEAGRVTEAIALLPARVDTAWWQRLRDYPVCFVHGRLQFDGPESNGNSAPFPSAVVYMGDELPRFVAAFADIGDTWLRVEEADPRLRSSLVRFAIEHGATRSCRRRGSSRERPPARARPPGNRRRRRGAARYREHHGHGAEARLLPDLLAGQPLRGRTRPVGVGEQDGCPHHGEGRRLFGQGDPERSRRAGGRRRRRAAAEASSERQRGVELARVSSAQARRRFTP